MSRVIKGVTMAIAVAALFRFLPDFMRYMKMRAM